MVGLEVWFRAKISDRLRGLGIGLPLWFRVRS